MTFGPFIPPRLMPITAIVPVRNAGPHLAQALASVATAAPAETIVIDGGSTDESCKIAAATRGVRLMHQRSRGLGAARNEAIAAATSPFIAFCDADDRWLPGGLAALHEALAESPEVPVAIGMVEPAPLEGVPAREAQRIRIGARLPGFTPGAMLARREIFERLGGFDETLSIGADSDWFVRLVGSNLGLRRVDRTVLAKGVRADSLSGDVAEYRRQLLQVARRHIDLRRHRR